MEESKKTVEIVDKSMNDKSIKNENTEEKIKNSNLIKKATIVIGLIFLVIIYKRYLSNITAQNIRAWISTFGVFAPIAYMFVWALLPIFFFPVPVLALAGGLSFGLIEGTVFTLIGAIINSSLMFIIAKVLAKDMVRNYLEKKLPEKWWKIFMESEGRQGFIIIFICRLIPIMPYNVINYAAGLTNISFLNYSLATAIGILPGTLVFINVGDKLLDVKSPEFVVSIILLIMLMVVSVLLGKYATKRHDQR